jgi:hypothetical protein
MSKVVVNTTSTKVVVAETAGQYLVNVSTDSNLTQVKIVDSLPIPYPVRSDGNITTATAGEIINGGRLVYIEEGKAYLFNPNNVSLYGRTLGFAINAAVEDADVTIQLNGIFQDDGFILSPGTMYFAGANGTLTTNLTGLAMIVPVGHSIAADKLSINFYSPIITN